MLRSLRDLLGACFRGVVDAVNGQRQFAAYRERTAARPPLLILLGDSNLHYTGTKDVVGKWMHRAFGTYWSYPSVAEIVARELPGCLVRVHSHGLHVPGQTLDTIAEFCHADPEREKHILILVGQNDAHQWSLPGTTRVEDLAVSMEEFRAWVLRQMERLGDFMNGLPHTTLHWAVPFDDSPDHFIQAYVSMCDILKEEIKKLPGAVILGDYNNFENDHYHLMLCDRFVLARRLMSWFELTRQ